MHRAELHAALASLIPIGNIRFNKKLSGFEFRGGGVSLWFDDGDAASADALVGADGVHLRVSELLFGADGPRFTGQVAYRAEFSTKLLNGAAIDDRVEW
jgi:2-polyprenyl-6-methoxyphenol hydroxylase-like FAD-dependent oxidoreductase